MATPETEAALAALREYKRVGNIAQWSQDAQRDVVLRDMVHALLLEVVQLRAELAQMRDANA